MELIIYTPKEDGFIQTIEFNKDEIKKYIDQNLEKYQGLIYDDNSIKSAKTDRSTLNNFKNALDTKRKEIKNKCLEPYNAFEASIKELIALIDQPLLAIDDQVKDYEARNKAKKREQALDIYNEIFEDYQEVIGFDSIEDKRWQNTTYNIKDVRADIEKIYSNIQTGVKIIKDKKSEFETTLLDVFFTTRDLDLVLRKEDGLNKSKEAMRIQAEKEARDKEAREKLAKEQAERKQVVEEELPQAPIPTQEPIRETIKVETTETTSPVKRVWFDFSLYLNEKEFNELKEWIKDNEIKTKKAGN